jgi:uncharacterized protein YjiS (DUF1127 family)
MSSTTMSNTFASNTSAAEGDLRRTLRWQVLSTLWSAFAAPVKGMMAFIAERRRIAREIAELSVLSDRMLSDIGVQRYDIEHIVRHAADAPHMR